MAGIYKDPIICFLIMQDTKGNNSIYPHPISVNWSDCLPCEENMFVPPGKVLAILPAPPESYVVYLQETKDAEFKKLGYEFKGAHHPHWESME